jgi:hypothetical protein
MCIRGLLAAILLILLFFYVFPSTAGFFQDIAQIQNNSRTLSQSEESSDFLFVSRPELLPNLQAFTENPFFGIGSWTSVNRFINIQSIKSHHNALFLEKALMGTDMYPHSHILQSLVWHGLLSLLFWTFFLSLIILSVSRLSIKETLYENPLAFYIIANLFFSPLGYVNRYVLIIYASSVVASLIQPKSVSGSSTYA